MIVQKLLMVSSVILLTLFPQDKNKMNTKLIYVMDPQCGWCYGNSKNITAIYNEFKDEMEFELLSGGMWVGKNAPQAGEQISSYIVPQIPRLTAYTGMEISNEFKTLISNSDYVLSSLEPSAAIVLFKKMAHEKAVYMSKEVQQALFVDAKPLDELETYLPILEKYNLDKEKFKAAWLEEDNLKETQQEFNRARSLANGFPTLILEVNGKQQVLASGYFELEAMRKRIKEQLKK